MPICLPSLLNTDRLAYNQFQDQDAKSPDIGVPGLIIITDVLDQFPIKFLFLIESKIKRDITVLN